MKLITDACSELAMMMMMMMKINVNFIYTNNVLSQRQT